MREPGAATRNFNRYTEAVGGFDPLVPARVTIAATSVAMVTIERFSEFQMPPSLHSMYWIQLLAWLAVAWGALRIVTGWGLRPLPIRQHHLGAFAGWLALAGFFSSVVRVAVVLWLGTGPSLMTADLSSLLSGDGRIFVFFELVMSLINFVALGTAVWISSWLVRRIELESARVDAALDIPKPLAPGWQRVYLSMAVAAGFLWPLSVAEQLSAYFQGGESFIVAAPFLIILALAAWLANGLVDDLLASKLMGVSPAPPDPRRRQVLWVGAVGLLSTGLSAIPNAILAIRQYHLYREHYDPPTSIMSWPEYLWIGLALLVGLSALMLRLLPKHHPESGPRYAFRGIRRVAIAVALASAMMWPLDFTWILIWSQSTLPLGAAASRTILFAIAIAVVVRLFTWRPPVRD